MSKIEEDTRLTLRQDQEGHWHTAAAASCEECCCRYFYSLDRPGIVWEAGADIDDACLNDLCDCHITPVRGQVFRLSMTF
jgi:hypothetical protein